ncbi:NAD-dependent epimerase/dehydratase family protein [Azospirillum agricola]|uniref:NAD-dependent epimerase/dehydratase family protein n=1 Tax=Azospirillum agricola TaxID=1720247 RepID=UPI000A0F337C|nr:NAD-dependent epimerase/dehydratase family protein [Azospirillum agricola]SMH41517.1 Nucleoside-diphosphate-sugar epimerase [Azospirillum lipoferum]
MSRSEFCGSTVLVTGGAGFIGSNLCHRLLDDGPERIVVVDNLLSADMVNVPDHPAIDFRLGSIADDRVLQQLPQQFDWVFHLATYHGNQSSMHDPLADHANNTLTTLKLFDHLATRQAPRKIIYASAGCTVAQKTFDAAEATTEDDPVSLYLDSPYQISKIVGELYGNYYFTKHKLPFVKARFQNVYGPREILGAGQWRGTPATVWRNVIPTFIWKALCNTALPVENGGIATRDFIYVGDLVEGLIACAHKALPGSVYNLATGVETSIGELAHLINSAAGAPAPVDLRPARTWDRSGKRYGDPTKARTELGFTAATALPEGLRQTVEWTRANRSVIERCITQHRHFLDRKAGL